MADDSRPSNDTAEKSVRSEPLDLDDGPDVVIEQQNVGVDNELGGGEFPDPDAPPSDAAPGPEGVTRSTGDPHDAAAREGGLAGEAHATESFADADRRARAEQATPEP
jgi:hypothetical protein